MIIEPGVIVSIPMSKLEIKRDKLHEYIIMKLEERDYHAVQDAGSDLRELEVEIRIRNEK